MPAFRASYITPSGLVSSDNWGAMSQIRRRCYSSWEHIDAGFRRFLIRGELSLKKSSNDQRG